MVKAKKTTKKADTEIENSAEVVEYSDDTSQENGIEDSAAKKKAVKSGKSKEEKETTEEIVENGEDKSEKKKTPAKSKKPAKKEPKPQVEPARKSSRTPKPVTKEGDAEAAYEVEKIVNFRVVNGVKEYLVRWKGYSRGDDTWEEESDLKGCADLLQKYKSENPGSTKKAKKRPSKSPAKASAAKKTKKEEDYEVEDIVGIRIVKGKKEFKIRWKGYKESDDSWEPEKHLSCQELIEKYLKENPDQVEAAETKAPAKKSATKKAKTPAKSKAKKSKKK